MWITGMTATLFGKGVSLTLNWPWRGYNSVFREVLTKTFAAQSDHVPAEKSITSPPSFIEIQSDKQTDQIRYPYTIPNNENTIKIILETT